MSIDSGSTVYAQLIALRDRQRGLRAESLLPIQPGGVEHQHANLNGDEPSFWMAYIYKPFHDEVARGMEQREESPEFKGSGN